jgi:hypothetical protein
MLLIGLLAIIVGLAMTAVGIFGLVEYTRLKNEPTPTPTLKKVGVEIMRLSAIQLVAGILLALFRFAYVGKHVTVGGGAGAISGVAVTQSSKP